MSPGEEIDASEWNDTTVMHTLRRLLAASDLTPCLLGIGVLLAGVTLAFTHIGGPPCLLRTLLHAPCPGCGLTRSVAALFRGNVVQSFRYHPLGSGVLAAAIAAAVWPAVAVRAPMAAARLSRAVQSAWALGSVGALMMAVWALRLVLHYRGNRYFIW